MHANSCVDLLAYIYIERETDMQGYLCAYVCIYIHTYYTHKYEVKEEYIYMHVYILY